MSRDPPGVSRRQVLAGVTGMGAFGLAGGATSAAYLSDRETVSSAQRAGAVGLEVECDSTSCETLGGKTTFAFGDLDPGDSRTERFGLSIDENPIRVWLRTACPPAIDPLGEALEVRLAIEETCGDEDTRRALNSSGTWTSLSELRGDLAGGVRVDDPNDPCLSAADDPCLVFDYRLPSDAAWAGNATSDLEFELVAEQCRHVPESEATSEAFDAATCPDFECEECSELGTVKLDDTLVPGASYELDGDDEHEIEVLQVTNAVDGDGTSETVCVAFRLLKDGDESTAPPICEVELESEDQSVTHDVDPLTRTRGRICTPSDEGDDTSRPGIDSITVFTCGEGGNGDCAPCENEGDERVASATFEYEGPGTVTVVIDQQEDGNGKPQQSGGGGPQQSNGGGPPDGQMTEVEDVESGDKFTVPLNGDHQPNFDLSVVDSNDDEWTLGTIHTSCSKPFGPGKTVTDDTRTLTVVAATNKNGDAICEVSER
ncbi:hypothetical protein ACFQAS_11705 [Halopenitus salinus]|uniref:SipW-cognate class signal peptide n=1 Tax=Halopenitus salinus TaxID=1198295 RepID=A0ABD5UTI9_9EURY